MRSVQRIIEAKLGAAAFGAVVVCIRAVAPLAAAPEGCSDQLH